MDFATLSALAEQARTAGVAAEGATFSLRRPTVDAFRTWIRAHGGDGRIDWDAIMAEHLPGSVVGWSGVTLRHFGGESDELVPHSLEAAALLLSDNKAVQLPLFRALTARMNEKLVTLEADEKNSSSVSAPG